MVQTLVDEGHEVVFGDLGPLVEEHEHQSGVLDALGEAQLLEIVPAVIELRRITPIWPGNAVHIGVLADRLDLYPQGIFRRRLTLRRSRELFGQIGEERLGNPAHLLALQHLVRDADRIAGRGHQVTPHPLGFLGQPPGLSRVGRLAEHRQVARREARSENRVQADLVEGVESVDGVLFGEIGLGAPETGGQSLGDGVKIPGHLGMLSGRQNAARGGRVAKSRSSRHCVGLNRDIDRPRRECHRRGAVE
ncbi:MAG: hypothetical protein HND58_12520 [Planctomycetota bacterium]|nr:MAG: hypothetical protein HND58_12520 [Planctomycetota bacterium]